MDDPARDFEVAPVVLCAFNRPDHTRRVFGAIRRLQPPTLFLIADGPRPDVPSDFEKCRQVREILGRVDWPCRVHRNYSEVNLGGPMRIPTGLDWVFETVDAAIILEDDDLPGDDFFRFATAMLNRYRDDERIWAITGNNFQGGARHGAASYFFSKYCLCWGWATWRRAWRNYSDDISCWPEIKNSPQWRALMSDPAERKYWSRKFDGLYAKNLRHWDLCWMLKVWRHGALTVTPNMNLVSNIGFGPEATNTNSDVLQQSYQRPVSPRRQIRRQDPKWCPARRPPYRATDQI